jgi:hypothetical protein
VGVLKLLAVLIAALGMAAVESVRPTPEKDDDDVGLFVGSAHPLPAKPPMSLRRR